MKIVVPPLIVEDSDGFKNDILDRKSYGDALLNLIRQSSDELVISLDGQWGEGKTTFIKMWQGLLNENNISNIYIDAFTNDYLDDAFVSIASAITDFVENNINKDGDEKLIEFKTKTKQVAGKLLTWSSKIAIKAATLGIIKEADIEELEEIKSDLAKGTSDLLGKVIEDRLNSHSKDIELIKSFRILLSEIPSKLKNENNSPLVVIIDELDRCRPSFAVEILEKIKHLFSVQNVIFVLVMHKEQLEEAVKCIYGQNVDARAYLQKFINLEVKLPKQTSDRYTNDYKNYSKRLLRLHELETWGDDQNIIDCIEPLAQHFNLSLRQLEKAFTYLALFYGSSASNHLRLVPVLAFLAVIKSSRPHLFEKLLYQKISYSEICQETGLTHQSEENHKLHWLISWVRYSLLSEQEFKDLDDNDRVKDFGRSLWNYSITRERIIPLFAQKLNMFVVRY